MLAALIRQSTEIQKVLAFDGIFEKLFSVVTREGGLEGQSVVTDALRCVDTLLRFNTSNQVKYLLCHPKSPDRTSPELLSRDRSSLSALQASLLQSKYTAGSGRTAGVRLAILERRQDHQHWSDSRSGRSVIGIQRSWCGLHAALSCMRNMNICAFCSSGRVMLSQDCSLKWL